MTKSLILFLLLAGAIAVPASFGWILLRKLGQLQRGLATLVGGQSVAVPIMVSIAIAEAGPGDPDAWGAVLGISIIALFVSMAMLWLLEMSTRESQE